MSVLSSPSTWRTHPHSVRVYAYISQPAVVFSCSVNQGSFEYPLSQFAYDTVTVGAYTDVKQYMTVRVKDSSGNLKAFTYIRELPSSTLLYVGVDSIGDIDFANNDIIEVLNDFRVWALIPSINALGEQFKSWVKVFNEATSQPPVANASPWYANKVDDSNIISVDLDGTNSFPVAPGATLSSYLWDVDDGSIISGTSSSSEITATFPPGERWVELEVTDSDSSTHKAHTLIVGATDDTALQVEIASLQGDVDSGWQLGLRVLKGDVSDYDPGSAIIVWVEEDYGDTAGSLNGFPDREHVIFCGWLVEEGIIIEPLVSDWDITAMNAVGILQKTPAFNQTTEYATAASSWFEISEQNLWRHAHYLMQWHSTLLTVCDVERPTWYNAWSAVALDADGGNLYEQFRFVANAVNARFTCDRNGRCYWRKNPQFMGSAERSSLATTLTLADTDWSDSIHIRRNHRHPVGILWGDGIVSSASVITARKSAAPGTTPGQGERQDTLTRQLISDQADLNTRTGRAYAVANLQDPTIPITVFLGGLVADPAWQEKIVWTLSTDKSTRQYGYSSQQFGLRSVRVSYDHATGATEEEWELEKLVDVTVQNGVTVQLPGQDPPEGTDPYIPSGGTILQQLPYPPAPDPLIPDFTNGSAIPLGIYALLWTDGILYVTDEFGTASPTWIVLLDDTGTQDVISVIYAPDSPFLQDNTQALNLHVLTTTSLWYIEDALGVYHGRTPTQAEKQSVSDYGLVRHSAGISGAAMLFPNADASLVTVNRLGGNGNAGLEIELGEGGTPLGVYSGDTYINNNEAVPTGGFLTVVEYVVILYTVPAGYTLTAASMNYTVTPTSTNPATATQKSIAGGGVTIAIRTDAVSTTTNLGGSDVRIPPGTVIRFLVSAAEPMGTATCSINTITITLQPWNEIQYTDDNGDTLTAGEIAALDGSLCNGDVDDFGLGISISGAQQGIYYATTYGGDYVSLEGLTGIDGSANITCVRIPYRKLAMQALNNDATQFQFIYGVDDAVSGATLWGVTFNANTGAIVAQSNMTPIVDETTYYVIRAEALETAGTNTQVILAACKPVGGGDTDLLLSLNGGTTWQVQQSDIDIDFVRWLLGSNTQATLSGADLARYTANRGVTMQAQEGNLTPTTIYGLQAFPRA